MGDPGAVPRLPCGGQWEAASVFSGVLCPLAGVSQRSPSGAQGPAAAAGSWLASRRR
ncbi:hypothetical protein M419DRAFT_121261 [Trichoderma reesei RUT C-30]|uniref:Uncharacterized protein n=1 Tax=Hypocrea jecorina (strain ATCC 56765 / BCRC 32924 / NRRL 11460 / Rut C-30) TaxID=1344414 RepID=A0A024RVV4_HYPJR|nr:hypothetical protein M419DRAFT_121261 [Trichoderma reesei RUT C-30]